MRATDSRVVAIVAPTGSGKTSLIGAVYDLFQAGTVAGVSFAGSTTLHAFEDACHDSRSASEREEAEQKRTPVSDVVFYHLQLGTSVQPDSVALLLADRAGESYRTVADDPKAAIALYEVSRAESLTILVDGARLLDSGDRHNVRNELGLILRALVDTNSTRYRQHLAIVLTKLDAVNASADSARAHADFDRLVRAFSIQHGHAFDSVHSFKVAASPKKLGTPRATGCAELLRHWLESEVVDRAAEVAAPRPQRAFGRLSTES